MSEEEARQLRPSSGFDLSDLGLVLRRRLGWLLLALVVGAVAGGAVYHAFPERFTGESTVLVESSSTQKDFFDTPVADSMRSQVQTLRHRLTSDRSLAGVLARIGPERLGDLPDEAARLALLRRDIGLEVVDGASPDAAVIRIAFTSADPVLARDIVNASTRQLIEERQAERTGQTTATEDLLKEQTEQLRGQLMQQAQQLDEIESESGGAVLGNGDASDQRTLRVAALMSLQQLEVELANARSVYTNEHPNVKKLKADLARQRALLTARPPPMGSSAAEPSARYRSLLRDYDSNVRAYEHLAARQIDAEMAQRLERSGTTPELRVLREAYLSVFPSRIDAPLFLGAGAGLGLALVAALFLVPALRRPSFASVERLAGETGLPVIAGIPPLARRRGASRARDAVAGEIVVATDPRSIAAEQYRRFLPYLPAASEGVLVLVTSAERGEGKSVTAANLAAIAAADGGHRVLLIDADLRRPTQHRLLGIQREPGLSDAVSGALALEDIVRTTSVRDLRVLTAGQHCDNPLHILEDDRFAALIAEARRSFDVVVMDAPPLLPVVDARLLERLAAMVVFVVRADRTPRAAVLRALEDVRASVGLVLNGIGAAAYRRYYRSEPYGVAYPVESGA